MVYMKSTMGTHRAYRMMCLSEWLVQMAVCMTVRLRYFCHIRKKVWWTSKCLSIFD